MSQKNEKSYILKKSMIILMAAGCGITVANLYYIQPLLAEISSYFHISQTGSGILAMLTQVGYGLGLFFFVPLGDIKERRSLIVFMLGLAAVSLLAMAESTRVAELFPFAFAVGFFSIVPQLILPFAAHLAKPEERGRVIGAILSGLLIGILLSRTFSGIVGDAFGWKVVYLVGAINMIVLAILLRIFLPVGLPSTTIRYQDLLRSLWQLIKVEPVLRETSINGAVMFGTFSVFWTTLAFFLATPNYHLGVRAAGMFGLIGITGALAAIVVGRIVDQKSPRFTVGLGIVFSTISFICFLILGKKIWGLIIGVIFLDIGTQVGQVSNQARIQALRDEIRSRLNTVFMVSYFIGGACGSFLGSFFWGKFGWYGVCFVGLLFQAVGIIAHFFVYRSPNKSTPGPENNALTGRNC